MFFPEVDQLSVRTLVTVLQIQERVRQDFEFGISSRKFSFVFKSVSFISIFFLVQNRLVDCVATSIEHPMRAETNSRFVGRVKRYGRASTSRNRSLATFLVRRIAPRSMPSALPSAITIWILSRPSF